jgi:hypothetical protein
VRQRLGQRRQLQRQRTQRHQIQATVFEIPLVQPIQRQQRRQRRHAQHDAGRDPHQRIGLGPDREREQNAGRQEE